MNVQDSLGDIQTGAFNQSKVLGYSSQAFFAVDDG